jgi:sarcosine oxidase subunit beta
MTTDGSHPTPPAPGTDHDHPAQPAAGTDHHHPAPDHDVAVIGAGIVGATTAFFLARHGLDVVLIDADVPASGASGGPGHRGVRANGRDPRELPLAAEAITLWERADELLGAPSGYEQLGGLSLIEADDESDTVRALRGRAQVQRAFGVPTEIIDRDDVHARLPGLSGAVRAAGWNPRDGIADHTLATRTFADGAVAEGARLLTHTLVEQVHAEAHQVRLRLAPAPDGGVGARTAGSVDAQAGPFLSSEEVLTARQVVIAANTGTAGLLERSFGIELPLWDANPQVAQIRLPEGTDFPHLVNHTSRPLSLKRAGGGLLTVTGGPTGARDADGRGITDLASLGRSLDALSATCPGLTTGTEVVSLDASRFDSWSADGVPVVDAVPGTQGHVLFAAGWSGHGFALGPASGKNLARWIVDRRRPEVFAPFTAARLGLIGDTAGDEDR